MTWSKYSELLTLFPTFLGSVGIQINHPLGSILGQVGRLSLVVMFSSRLVGGGVGRWRGKKADLLRGSWELICGSPVQETTEH